jgi:hypothetical protein
MSSKTETVFNLIPKHYNVFLVCYFTYCYFSLYVVIFKVGAQLIAADLQKDSGSVLTTSIVHKGKKEGPSVVI